jgi:cardiolipin synthase
LNLIFCKMSQSRTRHATAATLITSAFRDRWGYVRSGLRAQPWWETTLIGVGFVTLIMAVGVLFFGIDDTPRVLTTSDAVPPVESVGFAEALSGLVGAPMEQGGTIDVLQNGDEFVPALLHSIRDARTSINFSVYIWEDGVLSNRIVEALLERQSHGVQVRVLLDGLGGHKAPDALFTELRDRGGRVEKFRMPKFGTWTRFHRRNHRRSIVIDGRVGYTGGMAVADQWLGHAQNAEHWRDLMFKLTGPLAASLQGAFVDEWAGSTGEMLVGPRTYPLDTVTDATAPGVERFIHHINSPADDDHSMAQFFVFSMMAARERIYVRTPYFIPDDSLEQVLAAKARAGVDVRLLLPGPEIDNQIGRFSSQSHYEKLLAAGVRIFEYQPTFSHAKTTVVDGRWSIVGSPNLNTRSRQLDEENVFGVLDRPLAAKLDELFLADEQRSREVDYDAWRRRNPLLRLLQFSAKVLDQQS